MVHTHEYESLARDETGREDVERKNPLQTHGIRVSAVIILVCAVVDMFLVLYLLLYSPISHKMPGYYSSRWHLLESPNTYINFDKLYGNKSSPTKHTPIINQARDFIQVSSAQSRTVLPAWQTKELTIEGYIPVAENHLFLTSEISTLAEFRVLDYGMENCSLMLDIPRHNSSVTSMSISSADGSMATFDIWILSGNQKLNPKTVSWSTTPKRLSHVARIAATYGMKAMIWQFPCSSGSYYTFEVACVSQLCNVHGWHKGWNKDALYILQSQTI